MLGTYMLPEDESLAGKPASGRGAGSVTTGESNTQGLQSDFAAELTDAIGEIADKGITLTLGYSGFVSAEDAQSWAEGGNSVFLDNLKIFGWGLAAEIETAVPTTSVNDVDGNVLDIVYDVLDGHNLMLVTSEDILHNTNKETGFSYVQPKYVTWSADVTSLRYDPDNTTGEGGDALDRLARGSNGYMQFFISNQFETLTSSATAAALKGNRALANDSAVWNYVKETVDDSLRVCSSRADGGFIAWYPDYWGLHDDEVKTPTLYLDDVELIDMTITQSDSQFFTHVYAPGVLANGSRYQNMNLYTQGVVSVESNMTADVGEASGQVSDQMSDILKGMIHVDEDEEWMYSPKELYRRYGARPHPASGGRTLVESGDAEDSYGETSPRYILPFLNALNEFMTKWSEQYDVNIRITFMPQLFPGCRIKVKSLDVSFYVSGVSHSMDYSSGFTTTVTACCPSGSLVRGMVDTSLDKVEDIREEGWY